MRLLGRFASRNDVRHLFIGMLTILFLFNFCFAEEDPRVKALLQEGLRLYSERQYVRALDLFKQVQRIDSANATASEYVKNSEQRILEWESGGGDFESSGRPAATWDSLLGAKGKGVENMTNAKDIIATRESLVKRMRNRSLNTDNIVKIEDSKSGMQVTLFHDQLFLPGLQTLRDEALPILSNVADLIRTSGGKDIAIRSISHDDSKDPYLLFPEFPVPAADPSLPNMQGGSSFLFQDLEAIRAFILFTYLAQRSIPQADQSSVR